MRVALFGGSFNPPHVGHVLAAAYVACTQPIDLVLVVPVFEHALGKRLAPFEHRMEMARLAFDGLSTVRVSTIEQTLGAPSRTLRTVLALKAEHPDWELRLMVGSDILGELSQWHAYAEIERLAPPLIVTRAGVETRPAAPGDAAPPPAMLPDVSSTHVRSLLAAREDAAVARELTALVPRKVIDYVAAHGLYAAPAA